VLAGVAVTVTMLETFVMVDAGVRGGDAMRDTLVSVSAGLLVGRIWGMVEIVPVGIIFFGKMVGCVSGMGGTRLLLALERVRMSVTP
jgi:uncharacterized membrane protein